MKAALCEWLGYLFCEFSFRWFDRFDVPYLDEDWRWYHRVVYFVGRVPYSVGCYFYNVTEQESP